MYNIIYYIMYKYHVYSKNYIIIFHFDVNGDIENINNKKYDEINDHILLNACIKTLKEISNYNYKTIDDKIESFIDIFETIYLKLS